MPSPPVFSNLLQARAEEAAKAVATRPNADQFWANVEASAAEIRTMKRFRNGW
jgi:hypothetical protein